jgi:4'-phosphopantetheinyl transferase EntD
MAAADDYPTHGAPTGYLYPQEDELLRNCSVKRRTEFAAARACARRAAAALGLRIGPLMPGPSGAPQWPEGVTGSLTHCKGYRAAAVARREDFRTIGLDAEPHVPLPHGVSGLVASPAECEALNALSAADPHTAWDKLLFSAKETVYKTWFPLTGQWLRFRDATVSLERDGHFRATVLGEHLMLGRWVHTGSHLVTLIAVPA